MPDLDEMFKPSQPRGVDAYAQAQVWEAVVKRLNGDGVFVTVPSFHRNLMWGPLLGPPHHAGPKVGDHVAVAMSDQGRPWLLSGQTSTLAEYVTERLAPVTERVGVLEQRADALEARVAAVEALEARIAALEALPARVTSLEGRVSALEGP